MYSKAVFLDRDGTINIEKDYLYRIEDFEFLPGVIEGLKLLQDHGFRLVIITNQSGIARGYYKEEQFLTLNNWMLNSLHNEGIKIDKVLYCPHHPNAKEEKYRVNCDCRKPKLGLFMSAVNDLNIDLNFSYATGDKIRDCAICQSTPCRGFLISNNEKQDIIDAVKDGIYDRIEYADSLLDAVKKIIECK